METFHDEQAGSAANGQGSRTGKRVYIGNLSWDTRWQGLKDHMRQAGDVAHAEVFIDSSGRSAGCGIVEFESPEAAEAAINTMNDSTLDGRTIFVRADREEGKPRSNHYGDGDGSRFNRRRESDRGRKIVVWNLPYHIRWQDLKDLFRDYGTVIRADVPQTQDGKSKGMGTVLFETEMEADRAIQEMTGKEVDGRIVDCRLDKYA